MSRRETVVHRGAEGAQDSPESERGLGGRIRERRRSLGLTLVELAGATDLSHPFLSQIERDQAKPSMASLRRIAGALGVSEAALLAPSTASRVDVIRSGEGEVIYNAEDDPRTGWSRVVASSNGVVVQEFADGPFDFLDPYSHTGDESLYVVAGRLEVLLEGDAPIELGTRDTVTYPGARPHQIRVLEPGTRFLMIHTP
ncbi:MAG: XRE family transcriptional regulator [Acidimicrobiia bacterium]|nr:XRE family transcriptional regulator [Acidimicrobiia bacterium]MDH4309106.1 XRE family transcriptional regulator [Acidimicrobiia bacterium]MDH5294035.1 XRE family transcriptional regulator [Acidimicrobiia bacterium]